MKGLATVILLLWLKGVHLKPCQIKSNEVGLNVNQWKRNGEGPNYRYSYSPTTYNYILCEDIRLESGKPLKVSEENRNQKLKYIIFKNSLIRTVPANVFTFFHGITELYLNNSNIEIIEAESFSGLSSLKELYLQNNTIEKLINGSLNSLLELNILNLSKNKLRKLDNDSFNGLKDLTVLNLSYNYLISLSSDIFGSLISLTTLDLSHNKLYDILSNTFQNIPILQELYLNNNFLNHISHRLFNNMKVLRVLDVSGNKFEIMNFKDLPASLGHLNVSNNKIIDMADWSWLKNIETVDLGNNKISEIAYVGERVTSLYLSGNKFENVDNFVFSYACDLVNLDISHNLIGDIDKNVFQNLSKLERLDLSRNKIKQLPVGCFRNLFSLWELKLSYNSLTILEFGTFAGLNNLTLLYLDNNNLTGIYENSFYVLHKLKGLYLTNNSIRSLNIRQLLSEMRNIKMIGFNGNKWICSSLFDVIKTLTHIKIGFYNGTDYHTENIHGIACTSNENQLDVRSENNGDIGLLRKKPEDSQFDQDLKNSKFSDYLNNGFMNSTFYKFFEANYVNSGFSNSLQKGFKKTNFFKYFNRGFFNSSFFRYFDKDFKKSGFYKELSNGFLKNGGSHNQTNLDEEHETSSNFNAEASKLYSEPNLNGDFIIFANKITICVIINIALLIVMILVFLFVSFHNNHRYI